MKKFDVMGLLRRIDARRPMVFVNTKRVAECGSERLTANGFARRLCTGMCRRTSRKMMRDFPTATCRVMHRCGFAGLQFTSAP